jgi:hypothetical protein
MVNAGAPGRHRMSSDQLGHGGWLDDHVGDSAGRRRLRNKSKFCSRRKEALLKTINAADHRQIIADSFEVLIDLKPKNAKPVIGLKVDPGSEGRSSCRRNTPPRRSLPRTCCEP